MKMSRIIGTLLSIIIVTGMISGCVIASNRHDVDQREDIGLDDINHITVDAVASEIKIIVEDRLDVEAEFEGRITTTSSTEPKLVMDKSGNSLSVVIDYHKKNINIGSDDTRLTVYIPETYDGNLTIDSVSGDVTVPSMALKDVVLETVSGEIYCQSLQADYIQLETVSGAILVKECVAEDIVAESVSGELEVNIPESAHADIDTSSVSGKIRTEDGHGSETSINIEMDLSTVSGDITVRRY